MDYELLDFGQGRKLERFGPYLLDRPCATAEGVGLARSADWQAADARFERIDADHGRWTTAERMPSSWPINCGCFQLELKLTPFGHVGAFPEQAANWQWLREQIQRVSADVGRLKLLNLFAYTGGVTLAAAAAGAEVVHMDAAKNTIAWARRNAELSGLADRSIRWIVEDALTFVRREIRRGNHYDAVILDPPTFGHGPKGEVWRIEEHLDELLKSCARLTVGRPKFLLASCHSAGLDAPAIRDQIERAGFDTARASASECFLTARDGRKLPSGIVVRIGG